MPQISILFSSAEDDSIIKRKSRKLKTNAVFNIYLHFYFFPFQKKIESERVARYECSVLLVREVYLLLDLLNPGS